MKIPEESFVLHSWNQNAKRWNKLIEENSLESRRLVTNQAIIDVLLSLGCKKILDIGCGEGWLVRSMKKEGVECWGIDGSAELIKLAKEKGSGTYGCMSYGDIVSGSKVNGSPFEAAIFNFALFDESTTAPLLQKVRKHLTTEGKMVIQSLHPDAMPNSKVSRWEADVWQNLPGNFKDSYHWYLRSIKDWKKLFEHCQLKLEKIHEPIHPHTHVPLSVIFVLSPA
ncbi:cyclopropane fatty-acyl-phospholipid synthase-like methyltransferase [Catalinimonas alkaloidigena]|uniref:class I SAM-dependent methyltransferase n=1 Tax=Catalinimonas alkaloidigena TaxID=1075417 RepID=UPI0024057BDC|nr:methyltransferase domain-containing protein [Catalinimonas alkaloidigena]MDF9795098.1 cyclopropane fatty-acyl-phospholipid synthase-like methyltransferase [Catalinimonas alkaloidigena]